MDILPLTLSGTTARRKSKTLVGPIDLTITKGDSVMVMGPNGSGKTSLLRLMHGLERVRGGAAKFAVDDSLAQSKQSFVFQSPTLLRRTVRENVALPLKLRKQPDTNQVDIWLERIGLTAAADQPARSLSGGEKQKLALARAMITDPQLLFLDEPSASLDGQSTREIEAILTQVHANGTTVVMATHDMGQARRLGQTAVFIVQGEILEHGPMPDFLDHPKSARAGAFIAGDIVE